MRMEDMNKGFVRLDDEDKEFLKVVLGTVRGYYDLPDEEKDALVGALSGETPDVQLSEAAMDVASEAVGNLA